MFLCSLNHPDGVAFVQGLRLRTRMIPMDHKEQRLARQYMSQNPGTTYAQALLHVRGEFTREPSPVNVEKHEPKRNNCLMPIAGILPIEPGETRTIKCRGPFIDFVPRRLSFPYMGVETRDGGTSGLIVEAIMTPDGVNRLNDLVDGYKLKLSGSGFIKRLVGHGLGGIPMECGPLMKGQQLTVTMHNPTQFLAKMDSGIVFIGYEHSADYPEDVSRTILLTSSELALGKSIEVSFQVKRAFQPKRIVIANATFQKRQVDDGPVEFGCLGVQMTGMTIGGRLSKMFDQDVTQRPVQHFDDLQPLYDFKSWDDSLGSFKYEAMKAGDQMVMKFHYPDYYEWEKKAYAADYTRRNKTIKELVIKIEGDVTG